MTGVHQVVRNDQDQYAIVPLTWTVPSGWQPVGQSGSAQDCEEWVDRVWTDLRPASQRAVASDLGSSARIESP